ASLGSGKVVSILTDRDGSLWVGTWNGGVSRLSQANNLFASITPDLPLMAAARNPATISLAASHHQLWAGTADGLFELDLRRSSLQQIADQHSSYTYYSTLDLGEDIWFGHAQGITRLNKASGEYRELSLPGTMAKGPVRRMWATPEHIWLAIDQYGVVILDRALQQVISSQPFNRSITFIKPLGQQFVLVGSYNGLSWFDRNSGALLHSHKLGAADSRQIPGLPSAPMDYLASAGQRHWLATNGSGLFEMRSKTNFAHPADVQFVQYAEAQGLGSGQLKSMAADQQGNIWLSTAFGISVFTPASAQFRNFGHSHGTLQRDYINASATTLPDGSIAFGGMDGFTLFQPAQVMAYQARSIAVPQIQAIQINGAALQPEPAAADAALARILHAEQQLTIPAGGARSIGFDYSTREFIETNQVQFQYRLDPLDSDWTTRNAHQRSANFERLPPGHYSFRLRAGLPQMGWSDESQLNIQVLPLWWETWQARLLLFALLVALLLGTHFLRLRQLHKRQQELAWLVEERTRALEESKNKAEQTLQQLASTMKELVRTEKMAALGQLVAGVAHEVNTPLGVALTANSVVTEESLLLQQKLASGNIRRQELEDYLYKLTQAGKLLDHNLQRAAQLVANFKQVSVDRTADNRRQFNLALYLDELLESLSLMWRSRQIVLLVDCPDDIVMDSYPGTIGQIITNLTQNAIVHGFKDRDSGKISLSCARKDNNVQIIFADNGVGIGSADLERIFDPFFTTNRHLGGTGLGLHIVFNLITQKLGG
ncbi:MAG TPA: ATP-binding protein, partial [Rheinheimera sp.]|nr:ATP-binding protein [Rheinheimera sp.]